jgi:hypothetical protein
MHQSKVFRDEPGASGFGLRITGAGIRRTICQRGDFILKVSIAFTYPHRSALRYGQSQWVVVALAAAHIGKQQGWNKWIMSTGEERRGWMIECSLSDGWKEKEEKKRVEKGDKEEKGTGHNLLMYFMQSGSKLSSRLF